MHDGSSLGVWWRARRGSLGAAGLAGLLLTGAVLSACSSSTYSAATSTTTTTVSTTTTGATGSSSDAARIKSLSAALQAGQHATFKATYISHNASGTSETLTIEQKPPSSVFSSGTTSVINDGTHTYFCAPSAGHEQCVSESGRITDPLGSITALFDPTTILSEFQAAETEAAAHTAGYSLAFSSTTYAGLTAKCVNLTDSTQSVKYCVTDSGVLAYVQSAQSTFELTSYSTAPADNDFAPPPGATVITIPNTP